MNGALRQLNFLDRALEWFDSSCQWFLLHVVYAYEFWCLGLAAAALLVLWRKRWWGRAAFLVLAATVVSYLLLYRMHWYSWIAWPLIITAVGFGLSCIYWCYVLGLRLHRPEWRASMVRALRSWKGAGTLGGAIAGWLVLAYLLSVPWDMPLILMALAGVAVLLAWFFTAQGGGEQEFENYVKSDPRMRDYLDAIRILRAERRRWREWRAALVGAMRSAKGLVFAGAIVGWSLLWYRLSMPWELPWNLITVVAAAALLAWFSTDVSRRLQAYRSLSPSCLLADHRLPKHLVPTRRGNLWGLLFRVACWPVFRWFFRLLAEHEWMPNVQSFYIVDRVAFWRDQAWRDYDTARFGGPRHDEASSASADYVENVMLCREKYSRGEWQDKSAIPPELNVELQKPLRMRWLALTEALSECHALSDPPAARERRTHPHLLYAAELLNHAGEVQHEIVRDLRRCYRGANDEGKVRFKPHLCDEAELAAHFFTSANRCMEAYVERAERRGQKEKPIEYWLRRALTFRRHLLRQLEQLKRQLAEDRGPADGEEHVEWPEELLVESPVSIAVGDGLEARLAQMADHAAAASLWLELRRGDQARLGLHDDGRSRALDKLAVLEALTAKAEDLRPPDDPVGRVAEASRRMVHIWGLAVEQELEHLHPGSTVWWDQCLSAASLYRRAGSLRIRRLGALAKLEGINSRRSEAVMELG